MSLTDVINSLSPTFNIPTGSLSGITEADASGNNHYMNRINTRSTANFEDITGDGLVNTGNAPDIYTAYLYGIASNPLTKTKMDSGTWSYTITFKPTNVTRAPYQYVSNIGEYNGSYLAILLYNDGSIRAVKSSDYAVQSSAGTAINGGIYQVTVTQTPTQFKLYINGAIVGTAATAPAAFSGSCSFFLLDRSAPGNPNTGTNGFSGVVANAAWWDGVELSPTQVESIYASIAPVAPVSVEEAILSYNPVVYYKLNETSGTDVIDTVTGTPKGSYSNFSGTQATTQLYSNDQSLYPLNTTTGFVSLDLTAMDIPVANWSLVLWFRRTGTGSQILTVGNSTQAGFYDISVYIDGSDHIKIARSDGSIVNIGTSLSPINNDTTYYIAVVDDGDNTKLYVDGVLNSTVASVGGITPPDWAHVFSNPLVTFEYLSGSIGNIALFNTPLHQVEINDIGNAVAPTPILVKGTYTTTTEFDAATFHINGTSGSNWGTYAHSNYAYIDQSIDMSVEVKINNKGGGVSAAAFGIADTVSGVPAYSPATDTWAVGYRSTGSMWVRKAGVFSEVTGLTPLNTTIPPITRIRFEHLPSMGVLRFYVDNILNTTITGWYPDVPMYFTCGLEYTGRTLGFDVTNSAINSGAYSQVVESLSPVAYYRFEETTGLVAKDSIGTRDGTYINTPTLGAAGLVDPTTSYSATFTRANNEYVTVSDSSAFIGTEISVSALFKLNTVGIYQNIIHVGDNTVALQQGWSAGINASNNFEVYWNNGGFKYATFSGFEVSVDTTYHVVFTVDSTNLEVKCYVDGVLIGTEAMTNALPASTTEPTFIAAGRNNTDVLDGTLDEVAIYDYILTQSNVDLLFGSINPSYSGLVQSLLPDAYWRFNDTTGTTAVATVGPNGTYSGSPIFNRPAVLISDPTSTTVNLGATTNTGISVTGLSSSVKTISFILRVGTVSTGSVVFLYKTHNDRGSVALTAGGEIQLTYNTVSGETLIPTGYIVSEGNTYHIVVTCDPNGADVYVDGNNIFSTATEVFWYTPTMLRVSGYISNGSVIDTNTSDIELAELFLSQYKITPEQITALYSGYMPTAENGILALEPIGYWKLNDAYNADVLDYSGNGYDGSWVGVSSGESTQDDMLGDGTLGLKVDLSGINDTGYMQNTAIMAEGSADTGTYTWIGWIKGYGGTDMDVMSWYTTQSGGTKEYRGYVQVTALGDIRWQRIYQTGPDPINDVAYQSGTTTMLGLESDTPYLIALRESPTTTEILVNGSVVSSYPRVGMSANDTTYAPREGLRVGSETTVSSSQTHISYVHSAIYAKLLTDSEILGIYNIFTTVNASPTIDSQQQTQGSVIAASKTGSMNIIASMYGGGQDVQTAYLPTEYVEPDNYIVSNQRQQGATTNAIVFGQPTILRYSTHGLTTSASSTPASTPIEPRLINAGNYKSELDISVAGAITPSFGQITLDNRDGSLDSLIDKAFDGGSYKLYYGPKSGRFPEDFVKVVDTVMGKPTFDNTSVKIQLKDKMDLLNVPFASHTFQATGGLEGNSTVSGLPKQRVIGKVYGAPVQLLDASKLLYYVSQDSMTASQKSSGFNAYLSDTYRNTPNNFSSSRVSLEYARVFDGGTQLTNGTDYPSEYDIASLEPAGGVGWYRSGSNVALRLLSPPDKDVRVDIKTSPTGSAVWTINDIFSELGEITVASDSENIELPTTGGFIVDDPSVTYTDVISEFMKYGLYYANFTRDGEIKVAQVAKPNPAVSPQYEFNYSNTSSITIEQQTPFWKAIVNSGETHPSQVNTGISDIRKDEFTEQPYHTITTREDASIRSRHKLAGVITTNTRGWWTDSDINYHFDKVDTLLMEEAVVLTITLDRGMLNSTTLLLEIGDQVSVKIPRYNFNLGKNFIIHGVRHDYGAGKLTFTLWG